jgi:O-antigen/teichoic acid export membrane protein
MIKNIYIRLSTNIVTAAIGLVPLIMIIRIFGTEVWGRVTYYYSIAGVFSIFTDLGLSTAYNKFLASDDNPRNISAFIFLKLLLIVGYVIIFISAYFLKFRNGQTDNKLLCIVFVVLILELISQFFTATLVGKRDFAYMSVSEIIASVVLFVCTFFVCFIKPDIYVLASTRMVPPIVAIIRGVAYFRKKKAVWFLMPGIAEIRKYISFSLPIAFSNILGSLVSYIDKLVLGKLMGVNEVGLYQIAQSCYAFIDNLIKPVTSTMFTEIVHRIVNVSDFFHKRFQDLVQILSFFGGVLAIFLIFSSTFIVVAFFGIENTRAAFIIKFYSLVVVSRLFWRPYVHVIFAVEKHRLISIIEPLGTFVLIGCYYLLIPAEVAGIHIGAAALPIGEFVSWILPTGIFRIWILKREYGETHMLEVILKVWLPLAVSVFVGYLFKYSLLIFPVVFLAFIASQYFFNIITKQRWDELIKPIKTAYLEL